MDDDALVELVMGGEASEEDADADGKSCYLWHSLMIGLPLAL